MKKLLATSTLTILLGLTLAACSNAKKGEQVSNNQTLNLTAPLPLATIDISKSTGFATTGNVFESFYRLGKNGSTTPGLAKSETVSKDGKTWTFKLRNAKWSDGKPITANDFVYSWRRTVDPKTKAQYVYLFDGIVNGQAISAGKIAPDRLGIKALDKHTVQISLVKPIAYFKTLMAYPLFGPQSESAIKKYGSKYATKSKYMVYSGPFKMVDWNGTGNTWSYVKNDNYWDHKVVKLKRINYDVVQSPTTSLNLYKKNKIDVTLLSTEQLKQYRNSPELHNYSYSMITYIRYNFGNSDPIKHKLLNNLNIRRAISLSIDRPLLAKKLLGFKTNMTTGFVPHGLAKDPKTGEEFANQQKVNNTMNYNPRLAKKLWAKGLREVGITNPKLSLTYSNENPTNIVVTQYLKNQLESNLKGFTLDLKGVPAQIASQNAKNGDYDFGIAGRDGDFKDPVTFLQILATSTPYNYGKHSDKQYDELLNRAANQDANNESKRWQDLVDASQMLNKHLGATPLFQNDTYYLQKAKVKDIIHNTSGPQWDFKYTYIK